MFEYYVSIITESQDISQIIRDLRDDWIYNRNITLWDIGNGLCDEFAMVVMEKFPDAYELTNWNFMTGKNSDVSENDVWDEYALVLNNSPSPIPMDRLNSIHFGVHVWLYFNGLHYDAESPDGVNNFWKLPFFQRYIRKYSR